MAEADDARPARSVCLLGGVGKAVGRQWAGSGQRGSRDNAQRKHAADRAGSEMDRGNSPAAPGW
jgi:hypothetical protein